MSPARSASANARTRTISVTACRPRGLVAHLVERRVAQHAQAELRGDRLSSRRAAARTGVPSSVRGTPECTTSTRSSVGSGSVLDLERAAVEEQRVAGAPEHRRDLVLDAARHAGRDVLGALRGEREVAPARASKPATSPSASATATSNAALDDSPAPIGTVDVISRSAPTGARPSSASTRTTPATARPHAGCTARGSSVAVGGDVDRRRRARAERAIDATVGARSRVDDARRGRSPSRRPSLRGSRPGRRSG